MKSIKFCDLCGWLTDTYIILAQRRKDAKRFRLSNAALGRLCGFA